MNTEVKLKLPPDIVSVEGNGQWLVITYANGQSLRVYGDRIVRLQDKNEELRAEMIWNKEINVRPELEVFGDDAYDTYR